MISVALQTYTIRKAAQIDLRSALLPIKEIGITSLEVSRLPIDPHTAAIILEMGFQVQAVQLKFRKLVRHFDEVVCFCQATGCHIVEVSVLPTDCIIGGKSRLLRFCKKLNALSARYRANGLILAFHHHYFEFVRLGGKTRLDILLDNTSPEVKIVSDTYWAKYSGIVPEELIAKLGDRLIGVHLRDHKQILVKGKTESRDCPVGTGDIDFAKVLTAASAHAAYAAIEQNSENPVRDIATSWDHISHLLAKEK